MADYNPRYRDESAEYDVNYGKPGNYSYEQTHPAQSGMYNQPYAKDNYNRPPPYGRTPYDNAAKNTRYNEPPADPAQYRGDPRNRFTPTPGQYDYSVNNRYRPETNFSIPERRDTFYRGRGFPRGRPYNPTERPPYQGYQPRAPFPPAEYRPDESEEPPVPLPPVSELFSSLGQYSDIADGLDDAIAIASQGGIAHLKRLFVPHAGNSSIHELTTTFAAYGPLEVAPKKKGAVAYISYVHAEDAIKAIRGEKLRGFCARPAIAKNSRHSQVLKEYREQAELTFPSLAHSAGPLSAVGQKRTRPETKVATLPPPPRFHVRMYHSLSSPPDPFFSIQKQLAAEGIQVEKALLQPPFPPNHTVPITQEELASTNLMAAVFVSDDPSRAAVTFAPDAASLYPGNTPGAPPADKPLVNLFLPSTTLSNMIIDTTKVMSDRNSGAYRPPAATATPHGTLHAAVPGMPPTKLPLPHAAATPWNPAAHHAPAHPHAISAHPPPAAYSSAPYARPHPVPYGAAPATTSGIGTYHPPMSTTPAVSTTTAAPATSSYSSVDPRLQSASASVAASTPSSVRPMDPRQAFSKAREPEPYDPEAISDDATSEDKTTSETGKTMEKSVQSHNINGSETTTAETQQTNAAATPATIGSSVSKLLSRLRTI